VTRLPINPPATSAANPRKNIPACLDVLRATFLVYCGSSLTDVAIPPHITPAVERHLAEYVGASADSLLFPAKRGGHLQPSTFKLYFYKARAKAKRPDLRFHDLRHSGAVMAAQAGATLAELMSRLGHSTPAAALRYQHAAQGRDKAIAAALSQLAAANTPTEM
jgi:integrase